MLKEKFRIDGNNMAVSNIEGTPVYNREGQELGNIKDIVIDAEYARIAYTVVSFGGFMGIGDKYFAVPWEAFTVDPANDRLILNVDKKLMEEAPGFDKDNWPDVANKGDMNTLYDHYGFIIYW